MKEKVSLIIQVIFMFLTQLFFLLMCLIQKEEVLDILLILLLTSTVLTVLIALINVIFGVVIIFRGRSAPFKFTIVIKSILIPWYIINFVIWALLIIGSLNPFLMMAIPLFLFISVCFTYICMISTSTLNISYIFNQVFFKRNIKINGGIIISTVFQFIFCLDIVGSIMLPILVKKQLSTNL